MQPCVSAEKVGRCVPSIRYLNLTLKFLKNIDDGALLDGRLRRGRYKGLLAHFRSEFNASLPVQIPNFFFIFSSRQSSIFNHSFL